AYQLGAVAGQFPEFTLRTVRHKAAWQQAVSQEVSDPLAIPHVGLAPRYSFDVLGVDQQQLKAPFQQVVDRLPVYPCRLHRHMGHSIREEPVRQFEQVLGHGAEAAHLLDLLMRLLDRRGSWYGWYTWYNKASHHCSLMYVQSTASLVNHLHGKTPPVQVCSRQQPITKMSSVLALRYSDTERGVRLFKDSALRASPGHYPKGLPKG